MKVSIVTVVYNGADTIRDAIESVLSQTHADLEYIIVDGASSDGTIDVINAYGDRIQQFVSEPDRGIYDAMNKGIGLAKGDIIGILNADDLYPNEHVIARVVETFTQINTDAVYGNLVYADRNNPDQITRYWRAGLYRTGAFLQGWMPPHPTFFVRADLYRQFGLYNLVMRSAADYELMLRFIHKQKISLAYLNEVLVVMRTGGISNRDVKNRLRANQEDRQAWQLNELRPHFYTLWLKPLRKITQFFRRN